MRRHRVARVVLLVAAALALAACGPTVSVTNKTTIPVRVVLVSADGSETFAPSPGESSYAEVSEGQFTVTAVPDADWTNYAKLTRQDLNDQLANSQNLSGAKLLDLVRRLKEIASRMDQMKKAAGSAGSCSNTVTVDKNGAATVSIGADGKVAVRC
jgi:hypothetical protein